VNAIAAELATEWETAPAHAATLFEMHNPDIVIHLGVSSRANGLTLETHAYNATCETPDAAGATAPEHQLHKDGAATQSTRVPVEDIARSLEKKRYHVSVSDDPGRYLCNAVYHETLCQTDRATLFIHIPVELDDRTIPPADLHAALDIVLDAMLAM